MVRSFAVVSAMLLFGGRLLVLGQDKTPPKELIQYVQDAQKAGIALPKIQENAINAGWPPGQVSEAITQFRAEKEKPTEEPAAKNPAPQQTPEPSSSAAAPAAATPAPVGEGRVAETVTDRVAPPPAENKPSPERSSPSPAANPAAPSGGTKPAGNPNSGLLDDYEIGAGDVLKITVWHEPDASLASVVVPPNGKISMPLLHDVEVAGMKVPALEKSLTERLSVLINAPEVSVAVIGMNSKKIYLTGKVKREGPLAYTYRMTVMQALSEAGGLSDFAKKKGIYILRTENGRQFKLDFDYGAVLKGEHLETNYELIPGDMIVVP